MEAQRSDVADLILRLEYELTVRVQDRGGEKHSQICVQKAQSSIQALKNALTTLKQDRFRMKIFDVAVNQSVVRLAAAFLPSLFYVVTRSVLGGSSV